MTLAFIADGILSQEARTAAGSPGYCDIDRFERPWILAINMITVPTVDPRRWSFTGKSNRIMD